MCCVWHPKEELDKLRRLVKQHSLCGARGRRVREASCGERINILRHVAVKNGPFHDVVPRSGEVQITCSCVPAGRRIGVAPFLGCVRAEDGRTGGSGKRASQSERGSPRSPASASLSSELDESRCHRRLLLRWSQGLRPRLGVDTGSRMNLRSVRSAPTSDFGATPLVDPSLKRDSWTPARTQPSSTALPFRRRARRRAEATPRRRWSRPCRAPAAARRRREAPRTREATGAPVEVARRSAQGLGALVVLARCADGVCAACGAHVRVCKVAKCESPIAGARRSTTC